MRPLYLGRIQLRWCDTCHVPVLDEACGSCGGATRAVPVTPPGDARPAFPADVALVNRIYSDHFGKPLVPEGMLALMNKVPDPDRMEEVVVGGAVVGHIRYLPAEDRWEPIPRIEAGALLTPSRRFVVADEGAIPSIRDQGASLLAPGLRAIDDDVRAGDEVFILAPDGTVIGAGRARVSATEARAMERGAVVRTRRNVSSQCVPGSATWADAVAANRPVLDRYEATSAAFVREVVASHPDLPVTVSYSGGKDSLATLLVVRAALGAVPPLLFADTGFEFPETYANIDAAAAKYGAEVVRSSGETAFDATFAERGPPAVDARWCCGVCKLAPIGEAIQGPVRRMSLLYRAAEVRIVQTREEPTGLAEPRAPYPALGRADPYVDRSPRLALSLPRGGAVQPALRAGPRPDRLLYLSVQRPCVAADDRARLPGTDGCVERAPQGLAAGTGAAGRMGERGTLAEGRHG